jgi:TolB-like protein/Tfp pilus assembly protein PilF
MSASFPSQIDRQLAPGPQASRARLDSWKEIASYFQRDVRTVQFWEAKEGLPVHRQEHTARASVYAFPDELDAWFEQRARKSRPAIAEPQPADSASMQPAMARIASIRPAWKALSALVLAALLAGAGWLTWRAVSGPRLPGNGTIAVLPFLNLTGNSAQDYLSDGITDELTTLVASQLRLRVVARTSSFQFKGKTADVRSIGGQLDAAMIMEGSVSQQGDELRINAQLIRASDGYHLWSHIYDTSHGDSMAMEQQIVRDLGVVLRLRPPAEAPVSQSGLDQQAHNLDLLGEYYWNRRTSEDEWKAIGYFNQAIDRDPLYARAYLGLAQSYLTLGGSNEAVRSDVFPKAREAAEKALQIDPGLSEAHAVLAHLLWIYDWNYPAAEIEFRKVIAANPNLPVPHLWYGLLLMYQTRFGEAGREFAEAQALDPLNPIYLTDESHLAIYSGNYTEAIRLGEEASRVNPSFPEPHDVLGFANLYSGNAKAALDEFQKYYELSGHDHGELAYMALVYARMGNRAKAMEFLKRAAHAENDAAIAGSSPYVDAGVYALLGDKEQSYLSLQKAIDARSTAVISMLVEPAFQSLRSEPRFQQMLRTTGHLV